MGTVGVVGGRGGRGEQWGYIHVHMYLRIFDGISHYILPVLVDLLEQLAFLRHLSHDVLGGEDGLQIEPLSLNLPEGDLETSHTLTRSHSHSHAHSLVRSLCMHTYMYNMYSFLTHMHTHSFTHSQTHSHTH